MHNVSSIGNQWGGMYTFGQLNNHSQAKNKTESVEVEDTKGLRRKYWTDERMRNAKPYPMHSPEEADPIKAKRKHWIDPKYLPGPKLAEGKSIPSVGPEEKTKSVEVEDTKGLRPKYWTDERMRNAKPYPMYSPEEANVMGQSDSAVDLVV